MREFLLISLKPLLWVMTAVNAIFMVLLFRLWLKDKKPLPLLMGLVAFGLFYDALILSIGTVLPAGGALRTLSLFRFVLHCGLIPLIFPICGIALGFRPGAMRIIWTVTAVIIAVGLAAGFATQLTPMDVGGVARYASEKGATPGWSEGIQNALSYGPVLILIAAGIAVWVRQKTPHLFLSGMTMFAFAALGPATGNFDLIFYISMFGEVLMTLFMWLYARKKRNN